jgi:hypothetical protein
MPVGSSGYCSGADLLLKLVRWNFGYLLLASSCCIEVAFTTGLAVHYLHLFIFCRIVFVRFDFILLPLKAKLFPHFDLYSQPFLLTCLKVNQAISKITSTVMFLNF